MESYYKLTGRRWPSMEQIKDKHDKIFGPAAWPFKEEE
jgi:hypothetical protein